MAGDWIKFEIATLDKPEVIAIADRLGLPETQVIGCLLKVWCWFDRHTEDGNAIGNAEVTLRYADRISGVQNFGEAMQFVGWLCVENHVVSMPKFDRHNGKSAKKRALTARRVAEHKAKKDNAEVTPEALPREEKSIKKELPNGSSKKESSSRKTRTLPPKNWRPSLETQNWFTGQPFDFTIADMTEEFITGCMAGNYRYANHDAAFRKWSRKRHEASSKPHRQSAADRAAWQAEHDARVIAGELG